MAAVEPGIVADTGPLLALSRIDGLDWLAEAFGRILIPEPVREEALFYPDRVDAQRLAACLAEDARFEVHPDVPHVALERIALGDGERAAIGAALQSRKRVLLDDREARQIARSFDVSVVGTLGVLILAKRQGQVSAVAPLIRKLRKDGYYLSARLVREVLRICGEL